MVVAPEMDQGCLVWLQLGRNPRGIDPKGILTQMRSQTSAGGDLESDLPLRQNPQIEYRCSRRMKSDLLDSSAGHLHAREAENSELS